LHTSDDDVTGKAWDMLAWSTGGQMVDSKELL
jgi:hypothetical protein